MVHVACVIKAKDQQVLVFEVIRVKNNAIHEILDAIGMRGRFQDFILATTDQEYILGTGVPPRGATRDVLAREHAKAMDGAGTCFREEIDWILALVDESPEGVWNAMACWHHGLHSIPRL